MKNVLIGALIFAGGVGFGVLVTRRYFKSRSEEEIEELREYYRARNKSIDERVEECEEIARKLADAANNDILPKSPVPTANNDILPKPPVPTVNSRPRNPELSELAQVIAVKYGYKQPGEFEEKGVSDVPYVISPEEFGEVGYEQIELTYYGDGILADDDDEIIDDVEDVVGSYALTSFGKYEDDAVFVRNDARRCDYEILADHRDYNDVVRPHRVEV